MPQAKDLKRPPEERQDFPGGLLVNTSCFQCRGQIPSQGTKIPHTMELSLRASIAEPAGTPQLESLRCNEGPKQHSEDPTCHN